MSNSTRNFLGDFFSESELPGKPEPDAPPKPDAGLSVAELQAASVPLEWFEAVAITQGLCETLCKWGEQMGPVRIQPDTVFLNAAGGVNVTAVKHADGPTALQQVAELLRGLLADKAIPTPLRLALGQASVSTSLEDWSKMVGYYERPNRAELIQAVFERALQASASASTSAAAPGRPAVAASPVPTPSREEEQVVLPPPAVVTAQQSKKPRQFSRSASRYVLGASAAVGVAALVAVAAWLILPQLNRIREGSHLAGSPFVAEAAGDAEGGTSAKPSGSRLILQPALPPRSQRSKANAAATAVPQAPLPSGAVGSADIAEQPSASAASWTAAPGSATAMNRPADPATLSDSSVIYSRNDRDVDPPSAIYPHFPKELPPGVGPDDVAEFYVVVSETGSVESVRAIRVPETMAEAMTMTMSLSAAKAWRFQPGRKDGQPVKYRTVVWVLKS